MRGMLHAVAFALIAGATLTSAQAADVLNPPRHRHPYPAPPQYPVLHRPHWGWVLMPGTGYAPISPMDFSLATSEYWQRWHEPYPYCCPDPYYTPAYFP